MEGPWESSSNPNPTPNPLLQSSPMPNRTNIYVLSATSMSVLFIIKQGKMKAQNHTKRSEFIWSDFFRLHKKVHFLFF